VTAAIETEHLTRRFGDRLAVEDLTLTVPAGHVFGFLGPNGAGKTTTARMLSALITPSGGCACVAGYRLGVDNRQIRRSVGLLTESPGMYDRLTAGQNLLFFARLYDLPAGRAAAQVERYLRMLGLAERCDEKVGSFSRGMRQKLAIARALLHEPPVVFLDEPTAGLDPEGARTVRVFIKELRAEGRTIFLTTHNLPEADELCDQVAVFQTRLLRVDTPANLQAAVFGRGTRVRVVGEAASWTKTVQSLSFVRTVIAQNGALELTLDDPDVQNPPLVAALVQAGAQIRTVEPITHSLEDVYLQLLDRRKDEDRDFITRVSVVNPPSPGER
jgi:ABC-2 type transport system ATP-binding protein